MVMQIFKTVMAANIAVRKHFSAAAKSMAIATCASDMAQTDALYNCYRDAADIARLTFKLTAKPNQAIGFLGDFFEMRPDGFRGFGDLMGFWTAADAAFEQDAEERRDYPDVFRLLRTARGYIVSMDKVSTVPRTLLDLSLSLNATVLVRHIEQKSAEFVMGADHYEIS
jgi:hypothetical protein